MKLIAIIPAFNEESTIGDVIKSTSRFVDEILVISDGSTDSTSNIAKNSGATVIDNIVNRGLGKTIKRGYAEASRGLGSKPGFVRIMLTNSLNSHLCWAPIV